MFKTCCISLKMTKYQWDKSAQPPAKSAGGWVRRQLDNVQKNRKVWQYLLLRYLHQLLLPLLPADLKGHGPLVTIYLLLSPDSNSVINQWNTLHSPPPQLIGQWNGLPGHLFFDGAHFLYLRASCNSDSQHCQQATASRQSAVPIGRGPRGRLLELAEHMAVASQVLRIYTGSAIRPKNSRQDGLLRVQEGFILRDTADFSGLDQQIFYNLGSYESPESPLSL